MDTLFSRPHQFGRLLMNPPAFSKFLSDKPKRPNGLLRMKSPGIYEFLSKFLSDMLCPGCVRGVQEISSFAAFSIDFYRTFLISLQEFRISHGAKHFSGWATFEDCRRRKRA